MAARAGKHVLCEKPLDVTRAQMDAVLATVRASGVKRVVRLPGA